MSGVILDVLAASFTGCFAGLAISASVVDVPAVLDMGWPHVVVHFAGFYRRLRRMQTYNIILSSLSSGIRIACCSTRTLLLTAHCANFVAVWTIFAFTVKFMLPGNLELLAMASQPELYTEEVGRRQVKAWSKLNNVRIVLSVAAFLFLAGVGFAH